MRPIDADALKTSIADWQLTESPEEGYNYQLGRMVTDHERQYELYLTIGEMEKVVDEQPTIDAVPVVRCKDCKHRPIDTGGHNYGQDLFFPDDYKCPCRCGDQWYSWMPGDDWFCANGERREDD